METDPFNILRITYSVDDNAKTVFWEAYRLIKWVAVAGAIITLMIAFASYALTNSPERREELKRVALTKGLLLFLLFALTGILMQIIEILVTLM